MTEQRMKGMTPAKIAEACGGRYCGSEKIKDTEVTGVTTDSRAVEEGFLFAALKGARVDGHDFVPQVMEKGAACVLVERPPEELSVPYILVDSCYQALKDIAGYYRQVLDIPVVGITGSVGKTSTKEMIASVLEQKYNVWKTKGNFNNELGVPLTVFGLRREHEIAVLEMGISDFGEMHRLSRITRPNICVMTNIGQCHLENLKSRDGILRAKSEIFDYAAEGALACLNGDDDKLAALAGERGRLALPGREDVGTCFFGMNERYGIHAEHVENLGLDGVRCEICMDGERFSVHIPIPGLHMVYNALAGAAVGRALGLTAEQIRAGIEALKPTGGRNNILHGPSFTIIDDCYNANPVSMCASLDVLSCALGRKVALLGDMGELGADEERLHYEVGVHAAGQQIDEIVCTGTLAKQMAEGARSVKGSHQVQWYPDREALLGALPGLVKAGDTVLVKASHFMEFTQVLTALKKQQGMNE